MNKLLKVVFFVLLFVLVGELFYIFYYPKIKSILPSYKNIYTKDSSNEKTNVSVNPSTETKALLTNIANSNIIEFANRYPNTSRRQLNLVFEQIGYINEIRRDDKNNLLAYKISDDEGNEIIQYIIDPNDSREADIYKIVGNSKKRIHRNDLKNGQKIMIYLEQSFVGGSIKKSEFYVYD